MLDEWTWIMFFCFTVTCRTWLLFSSCHKVQHTCNYAISYYAWWMNLNYVILFYCYMPYMIVIFFMPQSPTYMQSFYKLLCLMNELELRYFILLLHAVHDCYFLHATKFNIHAIILLHVGIMLDGWTWIMLCYFTVTS